MKSVYNLVRRVSRGETMTYSDASDGTHMLHGPGEFRVSMVQDADRRTGRPLMPVWVASAQTWVPVLSPRRRKGEERRTPRHWRYESSPDPRIRSLERRIA